MSDVGVKAGRRHAAFRKRWYALWPITTGLALYPVNNGWLRATLLLLLAALWAGALLLYWSKAPIRYALVIAGILAITFLLLPGREADVSALRRRYLDHLAGYEGTRYIWGGENRLGIDCSGLVRSALIKADCQQGLATFNPQLVRAGISLWWHDCSARALGDEYRNGTRLVLKAPSLNELDYERLQPADMAVTEDGVHVLAYLGNQLWIEADPDVKKVIKVRSPSTNVWFGQPVKVVRWTQLQP